MPVSRFVKFPNMFAVNGPLSLAGTIITVQLGGVGKFVIVSVGHIAPIADASAKCCTCELVILCLQVLIAMPPVTATSIPGSVWLHFSCAGVPSGTFANVAVRVLSNGPVASSGLATRLTHSGGWMGTGLTSVLLMHEMSPAVAFPRKSVSVATAG